MGAIQQTTGFGYGRDREAKQSQTKEQLKNQFHK
jgi:hypothetical protein